MPSNGPAAARVCALRSHLTSAAAAQHEAFEVVSVDTVAEFNCEATLYRHRLTGCELLSVVKDDDNKVFGVAFRTPPSDSTGVAHVLEHSVLCGSR